LRYDINLFHQQVAYLTQRSLKEISGVFAEGAQPYWHRLETGLVLPLEFYQHYCGALTDLVGLSAWSELRKVFTYAYFRRAFGNIFTVKLDAFNFMRALKVRGAKIILVSNNNPIHYEYCCRASPDIFRIADECLLSHEVGLRKPNPAMWQAAAEYGNFNPSEAMAIDDKAENIDGALLAGMMGHVFTTVPILKKDLENRGFKF
jgi:putative hydrolase of the HAD superfamily